MKTTDTCRQADRKYQRDDRESLNEERFGIGIYYVMHGSYQNMDVSTATLAKNTQVIIDTHPKGKVVKVNILSCFAAGLPTAEKDSSPLRKYCEELVKRIKDPSKMPMVAGYNCLVTVAFQGNPEIENTDFGGYPNKEKILETLRSDPVKSGKKLISRPKGKDADYNLAFLSPNLRTKNKVVYVFGEGGYNKIDFMESGWDKANRKVVKSDLEAVNVNLNVAEVNLTKMEQQ